MQATRKDGPINRSFGVSALPPQPPRAELHTEGLANEMWEGGGGRDEWLQGRVAACPDSMTVCSATRVSGNEAF